MERTAGVKPGEEATFSADPALLFTRKTFFPSSGRRARWGVARHAAPEDEDGQRWAAVERLRGFEQACGPGPTLR